MKQSENLVEKVFHRLTIEVEASGRHIHLSRQDVDALFGVGYQLQRGKPLSQPGQYACNERVTLVGPKGELGNVVVLGPERETTQVEISLTDAVVLGVSAPVRLSGDLNGSAGLILRNGNREISLQQGVIVAKRHIHMSEEDSRLWGLKQGDRVDLRCFTSRPVTFHDVEVRVSERFVTVVHLDYDEANGCGYSRGDRGVMLL